MRLELFSVVRRSRLLQGIAAAFGVIVLGAIGSGLWDLALSRIFDFLGNAMLSAASWAFGSFADFMYRQVSRDPSNNFARLPYVALVTTILILPWVLSIFSLRALSRIRQSLLDASVDKKQNPDDLLADLARNKRKVFRLMLPAAAITTLLYASVFYQDVHTARAAMFVERSIAILAPHIDNAETLRLQAGFRSIETADDFYKLEDELRSLAGRKGIVLPKFESIR